MQLVDDLAELLFADQEFNLKAELVFRLRYGRQSRDPAESARLKIMRPTVVSTSCVSFSPSNLKRSADFDLRVQADDMLVIGHDGFVEVAEHLAFARFAVLVKRQVVGAQHHVLCRDGDRASVRTASAGCWPQASGSGLRPALRRKAEREQPSGHRRSRRCTRYRPADAALMARPSTRTGSNA